MNAIEWMRNNLYTTEPECQSTDLYKKETFLAKFNCPGGCTPVPECMPKQFHDDDLLVAYRKYYQVEKRYFAKLRGIEVPTWFKS